MLRWLTIVVSVFLICAVVLVVRYDEIHNTEGKGYDIKCTQSSEPSATVNTLVCTAEHSQKAENGKSEPAWWHVFLTWPEGVAALAVLATMFFIGWQAWLTRQAIMSADAATRTELRAYVGVLINNATFQERDKNTKFAGIPALTNTGKTPAHKVRYRNNAAVLMEPISKDYVFPAGPNEIGEYVLGMNMPMIMHTDVVDYFDPAGADDILYGRGSRVLYSWGTVFYEDVFGDPHQTDFCHRLFFFPDSENVGRWKVGGHYIAGRNTAT